LTYIVVTHCTYYELYLLCTQDHPINLETCGKFCICIYWRCELWYYIFIPIANPRVAQPELKVPLILNDLDNDVCYTIYTCLLSNIYCLMHIANKMESHSGMWYTVRYSYPSWYNLWSYLVHAEMLISWRSVCNKQWLNRKN